METEALHKEKERLESAINDLKSKIDLRNQEIHKYTKDISLAKVLEVEYIEEVESLLKSKSSVEQDLKKEVKRVKDSLVNLKICRQDQIAQKSKIVETLQIQITERKRVLALKVKSVKKNDDVDQETERNSKLKKEIDLVTAELAKIKENYDDLKSQNQELNATEQLFKNKSENLRTSLQAKSKELEKIQDLMQDLQKTNFENKLKLDSLKCKPLDPTKKGNSMFGEVEDSCVKLQRNLQQMKKFNSQIEGELKEDFKKMQQLIQDNGRLKKNLEDSNIYENEYRVELEKFQSTVPFLETKIEEYKNEIFRDCKFVAENPSNFVEYINSRIKSLWKRVVKVGDELNTTSQEVLNTFKTLEEVNKNLRKRKKHNFFLECTMDKLGLVLLLLQIQGNIDFNEIKKIFKENSYVIGRIEDSKIEKKPLQENNSFNTSFNENVKDEHSANLLLEFDKNCDIKGQVENSMSSDK